MVDIYPPEYTVKSGGNASSGALVLDLVQDFEARVAAASLAVNYRRAGRAVTADQLERFLQETKTEHFKYLDAKNEEYRRRLKQKSKKQSNSRQFIS